MNNASDRIEMLEGFILDVCADELSAGMHPSSVVSALETALLLIKMQYEREIAISEREVEQECGDPSLAFVN